MYVNKEYYRSVSDIGYRAWHRTSCVTPDITEWHWTPKGITAVIFSLTETETETENIDLQLTETEIETEIIFKTETEQKL